MNNDNNILIKNDDPQHIGFDVNLIDKEHHLSGDTLESESFYRENRVVHIGFVISCMTIMAAVASLLLQTFDEKQLVYHENFMGKTQPAWGEGITNLK